MLSKCPQCPFHIDVSGLAPGEVVRCPNCRASVRLPGAKATNRGNPSPGRPAVPRRTARDTIERVYGDRKRSIMPLAVVAGLLVGGAVIAFVTIGREKPNPVARLPVKPPSEPPAQPPSTPSPSIPPPPPPPPPPAVVEYRKIFYDGREYKIPVRFQPGAAAGAGKTYPPTTDPALLQEASAMLKEGKVDALMEKSHLYFLPVLAQCLSDDEKFAREAFQFLDRCAVKYKIADPRSARGDVYRIDWEWFTDPGWRAGQFEQFFTVFLPQLQKPFAKEAAGKPLDDPDPIVASELDWNKVMADLKDYSLSPKSSEKYEYTPDSTGIKAYAKLKGLGKEAYPYLVKRITDEDPAVGRTAVVVLQMLTGYASKLPRNSVEQAALQREWMGNLAIDRLPE